MSEGPWHLVVVTGASSGFGKALAAMFAERVKISLHIVLVGRSVDGLEAAQRDVATSRNGRVVECEIVVADLRDETLLPAAADKVFALSGSAKFCDVTFVSNAGTLGPLGAIGGETMEYSAVSDAIQLNITTPMFLISECVRRFQASACVQRIVIVNVSSLWAREASSTFSVYCATKASMDMFIRVLAAENPTGNVRKGGPTIRVLNYAPGPLETAMQESIRSSLSVDKSIQDACLEMHREGKLADITSSAKKCVRMAIEERLFETGSHVDFFDLVEGIDYPREVKLTCCTCTDCQCGSSCQCKVVKKPQCDPCAMFMAAAKPAGGIDAHRN